MAKKTTKELDLRLSKRTISDAREFQDTYGKSLKDIMALVKALKSLSNVNKGLQMKAALGAPGGLNQQIRGADFKAKQQANEMARYGTNIGQAVASQKKLLGLAKQGLQYTKQQSLVEAALKMKLDGRVLQIRRINSLKVAQKLLDTAQVRLGLEAANGNRKQVQSAQRIVNSIQKRVELLKLENKERVRAEREARKLSDTERGANSRRQNMQRLFGDGGASLLGVQAGLSANYAILGGIRSAASGAVQFTVQLDEAFRNLQAITATTDGSMVKLKKSLIDVSEQTKFTAVEVAQAAIVLGQAGLSTKEITDSVAAITLLATATGTDLPRAVDIATSVLGVFNMESSQMANVANVMTEAVNSSKLTLEKLTLGLQYSGNIAAQSGIGFDELTAALGAMANAGIRSGSTLGTGMRQILIALQKPSGEFKATLDRLGLTMFDVDLRTKGLYGSLSALHEAGFTAGDAIRSFEVRAAAAFNAISNNLGQLTELETSFQNTTAATRANEVQMRSLSNQSKRFASALGSVTSTGLEPMMTLLRDVITRSGDFMTVLREFPTTLRVVTTSLLSLGIAFAALHTIKLVVGLRAMFLGLMGVDAAAKTGAVSVGLFSTIISRMRVSLAAAAVTMRTTTTVMGVMGAAFKVLLGPVGLVLTAVGLVISAFSSFGKEAAQVSETLDAAKTSFDNAVGEMESLGGQIDSVDGALKKLLSRYDILNSDNRMLATEIASVQNQFWEMGVSVSDTGGGVDDLITTLRDLRTELSQEYVIKLSKSYETAKTLAETVALDRRGIQDQLSGAIDNSRAPTGIINFGDSRSYDNNTSQLALGLTSSEVEIEEVRGIMLALRQSANVKREEAARLSDLPPRRDNRIADNTPDSILANGVGPIEAILALAVPLLENLQTEKRYRDEAARLQNRQQQAAQMNTPRAQAVSNRAETLNLTARSSVYNAIDAAGEGAQPQYQAAVGAQEQVVAEAERIRSTLDQMQSDGILSPENVQLVETVLAEAIGETNTIVNSLAVAAEKVSEANAQSDVNLTRSALRKISQDLRKATTPEEANDLLNQQFEAISAYVAAREAAMSMEGLDPARADKMRQELEAEITSLLTAADDGFTKQLEAIQTAATRLEQGRQEELAQANLDQANAQLNALEKQLGWAETVEAANEIYQQIIRQIASVAEAQSARDALKLSNNPEAAAALAEQRRIEVETQLAEAEATVATRRDRISNPSRRRGGGGVEKSAITQWMEGAANKLVTTDIGIREGQISANEGISRYQNVLKEAQTKLAEVVAQMGALQGRLASGTLTAEEQKKLNGLVEEHGQLVQFVAGQETEVLRIMREQGNVQQQITAITQEWANSNLNLTNSFATGVTNVLGTAKTALTDFFTSWSDGTKSGKEAFKDLSISVIKSIQQMLAEMLSAYIMQKALGWLIPGLDVSGLGGFSFSAAGGGVKSAAAGGAVEGTLARDSQKYLLMPGEYVMRKSAVDVIGRKELDRMNAAGNKTVSKAAPQGVARAAPAPRSAGQTNVYVVSPDQQPVPGPNDIIAIIGDDIARGGSTKKLIKSVQTGI